MKGFPIKKNWRADCARADLRGRIVHGRIRRGREVDERASDVTVEHAVAATAFAADPPEPWDLYARAMALVNGTLAWDYIAAVLAAASNATGPYRENVLRTLYR